MLNANGDSRDLVEIWRDYHNNPKIQKKFPLPPGGTGDCCAPKLLQYAYQHQLKPVCMAEFWWGPSPASEIRHHGEFYPACRGKCKPVLTWMLQGLDVDPDPEQSGFLHQGIEIIYEDDAIAAVYKPSGMLSVPGKADEYSVATWAKERWPESMLPHRLDLLTSGIMLVAKTAEVYRHLQDQFAARTIKKKYVAVVEGEISADHGVIDLPLSSDPLNRPRQIVDHEHGKRAITEYRVLEREFRNGKPFAKIALYPHTGRTHQLRMHCAHQEGLGCPIVGDELYGHKSDRLYLQAESIAFVHPSTGRRMHLFCPPNKNIW
jgi:tRNA pseudouridine32 synthase/23S rRNA pseudouridine746 synthase